MRECLHVLLRQPDQRHRLRRGSHTEQRPVRELISKDSTIGDIPAVPVNMTRDKCRTLLTGWNRILGHGIISSFSREGHMQKGRSRGEILRNEKRPDANLRPPFRKQCQGQTIRQWLRPGWSQVKEVRIVIQQDTGPCHEGLKLFTFLAP